MRRGFALLGLITMVGGAPGVRAAERRWMDDEIKSRVYAQPIRPSAQDLTPYAQARWDDFDRVELSQSQRAEVLARLEKLGVSHVYRSALNLTPGAPGLKAAHLLFELEDSPSKYGFRRALLEKLLQNEKIDAFALSYMLTYLWFLANEPHIGSWMKRTAYRQSSIKTLGEVATLRIWAALDQLGLLQRTSMMLGSPSDVADALIEDHGQSKLVVKWRQLKPKPDVDWRPMFRDTLERAHRMHQFALSNRRDIFPVVVVVMGEKDPDLIDEVRAFTEEKPFPIELWHLPWQNDALTEMLRLRPVKLASTNSNAALHPYGEESLTFHSTSSEKSHSTQAGEDKEASRSDKGTSLSFLGPRHSSRRWGLPFAHGPQGHAQKWGSPHPRLGKGSLR